MATAVTTMYSNPLYDAETKHATSTKLTQQQEEVMENEQFLNTLFCRALYDYEAQSESSLSFRKGEVIEVLTQEPSGWWDGLLGDDRGWFPSNYVQVISDEEAEQIYLAQSSGTESSMLQTLADSSMVDRSHGMMRGMGPEADEWLENETLSPRYGIDLGNGSVNTSQTDDYWMPEVGPNGQVCSASPVPAMSCLRQYQDTILREHSNRTTFSRGSGTGRRDFRYRSRRSNVAIVIAVRDKHGTNLWS